MTAEQDDSYGLDATGTGGEGVPHAIAVATDQLVDLESPGAPAEFLGDTKGPILPDDAEQRQLAAGALARHARDSFRRACNASDQDDAEPYCFSALDAIEDLWRYVGVRTRAFQDLLGLLEAAVKGNEFHALEPAQRDVIQIAFRDLAKPFLDQHEVDAHNEAFARNGIDIMGPLRPSKAKKFRVIVEEIE